MRRQGWEVRLAEVIEAARERPYELGVHDCFRVACQAVLALTGEDLWSRFSGYRTKREALAYIARHGRSFDACFDHVFGVTSRDARMARRGDLLKFVDELGEAHLGVCVGSEVAVLLETGLGFVPRAACERCWRIG